MDDSGRTDTAEFTTDAVDAARTKRNVSGVVSGLLLLSVGLAASLAIAILLVAALFSMQ